MGMFYSKLWKSMWWICIASGSIKEVFEESSDFIAFNFNKSTYQELCVQVRCLVINAINYDVFIEQKALLPPGFTIGNWFEHAYYEVDWEIDGHHLGYIPFDLYGNHNPMAHHCMFKEAHIIFYIQQVSHEWIEGDEKETAYAQATKSLRVVLTNIQQGPKVLQKFKATQEPLVKTLSNFENMKNHGESIKPVLCQLIA